MLSVRKVGRETLSDSKWDLKKTRGKVSGREKKAMGNGTRKKTKFIFAVLLFTLMINVLFLSAYNYRSLDGYGTGCEEDVVRDNPASKDIMEEQEETGELEAAEYIAQIPEEEAGIRIEEPPVSNITTEEDDYAAEPAATSGHENEANESVSASCTAETGNNHNAAVQTVSQAADAGQTEDDVLAVTEHVHSFSDATCTSARTCSCGQQEGSPLGHDYRPADCVTPETCSRCGAVGGPALGHQFSEATCETPQVCGRCGAVQGNALGHDLRDATCESAAYCARCMQSWGNALGHDYRVIETGTEGSRGYTRYACSGCGKENVEYEDYSPPPAEDSVYSAIMAMKDSYPDGTHWDNDDYYGWTGGHYTGGFGCAGFAFMLSDAAFYGRPAEITYDPGAIRVGDILRVNDGGHSVIVLEVDSGGVTVAEGNFNHSVHWGRYISYEKLDLTYIMTRY